MITGRDAADKPPTGFRHRCLFFPFPFFLFWQEEIPRQSLIAWQKEAQVHGVLMSDGSCGLLGAGAGWILGVWACFCVGKDPRFRGVGPCKRQAGSGRPGPRSVRARGAVREPKQAYCRRVRSAELVDTLARIASYGIVQLAGHLSVELATTRRTRNLRLRRCDARECSRCSEGQRVEWR